MMPFKPSEVTGQLILTRNLTTIQGNRFSVRAIKIDQTIENTRRLVSASEHWQQIADSYRQPGVPSKVPGHAQFAAESAWYGANWAVPGSECNTIVLADGLDRSNLIEAVVVYTVEPPKGDIILFTVSPEHQPGVPDSNRDHPRGLGSVLLDAVKMDMQKLGVQTIEISPLDRHAEDWWRSKGFGPSNGIWTGRLESLTYIENDGCSCAGQRPLLIRIAKPTRMQAAFYRSAIVGMGKGKRIK